MTSHSSFLNKYSRQRQHSTDAATCRECGNGRLTQRICNAIGQVDGVGLHTPLRVEIVHCDRCDHMDFTGNWSIAVDDDPAALAGGRRL